jgi:hypothetical protein
MNNEMNIQGVKMDTKRPTVVTIAAIVLVVLCLFVAGLGLATQFGLIRGLGGGGFVAGQFRNRQFNPQNGVTNNNGQNGFPNINGQNGFTNNNGQIGTLPNDQTNQGTTPNFTPNRQFGTGLASVLRLLQPVMTGLDIVLLILSIVAVVGLLKNMRWGAILGIVLSVLVILLAIPGFIRLFSAVVLIENLVRILLAVAVIVLLLLPIARKSYLPAREEEAL